MSEELNIGLLLFIAHRALENRVFAAIVDAGFDDLTLAQARLLQRIGPDGTRATELAEAAQVTKQTTGFLVDQLERLGYVERVRDPSDGRARLVRLTEKALAARPAADEMIAEIEAEWTAYLGARRMGQLRDALTQLREITDPYR